MKQYLHFILTSLLITLPLSVFGQTQISGHVTDVQTGEPLVGATIIVKGEKGQGTITDAEGNYILHTHKESPLTISVGYIGYHPSEIDVYDTEEPVNIKLREKSDFLNEVVVIGYGTLKREQVASSISTIENRNYKDVPSTSFDQVLQGRSSGVQLTTPSGNLGTAPIVRVRGVASITSNTSPLYVVDGVPIQSGNLSASGDINVLGDINPNDIESINILKDAAAAALYGSRAGNGVILITTKHGEKGSLKVSYDGWAGFSAPVKYYDVLNAEEFVNVKNFAVKNRYGTDQFSLSSGQPTTDGTKAFNLARDKNGNVINTKWNDYVFQTGFQQSHTANISGGNDKAIFHASVNYLDQDGILQGDKYKRLGSSFNVDANVTNWLILGTSHKISLVNQETGDRSRGGNIMAYSALTRMAWADAPNISAYDENGNPTQLQGHLGYGPNTVMAPLDNPASVLESGSLLKTEDVRWLSVYYAELKLFNGFTLRTQYGRDFSRIEDRDFYAPTVVNGFNQNGQATNIIVRNNQYTWTNTATYDKDFGNHHINLLFGNEVSEKQFKSWGSSRTNLIDNSYKIYEAAYKNITAINGQISENGLASFFGRANYDYLNRYIISINARRDGFSALSTNHRWGNFGGVAAAWRISDESFFKPLKNNIDDLKIKASWGVVGNTGIADYASRSYYKSIYYGNNGAYAIGQIGDSNNLKWETSKKFDLGFSASLWGNIAIDFDYYNNTSSDLILNVPVAPSKGIPNDYITTNAGAMRNTGFELSVSADVIRKKNFTWTTSFNITTNSNEVTKLSNGLKEFISVGNGETTNITQVGKSIGQLYLYQTRGIDKTTGRRIFVGENGENVLVYYEKSNKFYLEDGTPYSQARLKRVVAGNTLPTWYGGWTNNFKYNNFDLSLFFQFSGGNKIYNGSTATLSDVRFWNNSKDYAQNYWTPDHTNAKYALPVYGDNYSNGSALPITDWVENGDYIRLKNISLGYTFLNKSLLKNIGVSALRIYAQAQNLFVITGYSGLDPEVLSQTSSPNLLGGTDHNTAPQARTFTFGAQVTF